MLPESCAGVPSGPRAGESAVSESARCLAICKFHARKTAETGDFQLFRLGKRNGDVYTYTSPSLHIPRCCELLHLSLADLAHAIDFQRVALDAKVEPPRQTAQQIIGLIDANKDGKISLQEYEAGPLGDFDKIDTNHDGTVSAAEIQAAKATPKK